MSSNLKNEHTKTAQSLIFAPPISANQTGSRLRRLGMSAAMTLPLISLAASASAADTNSPLQTLTKPIWLTDLSVGVKESYDDNVFLYGTRPGVTGYPSAAALNGLPSYITQATSYKSSFVTTASPKLGVNFAPLISDQSVLQSLTLGYAPDFVTYHSASSESYQAHRINSGLKLKADDLSVTIDNTLSAVDGDKYGPLFPGGLNSSYSTANERERRDQIQDKGTASIQYKFDKFFVRPTASLATYDLHTVQLTKAQAGGLSGYQNYADRYDINGGLDVGYQVITNFYTTVGYRYGSQLQQQFSHSVDSLGLSSSSDYQRVLFGVEGKPVNWLEGKVQIGPDFRSYGDHAAIDDHNLVTYYGEASLTATLTPKDSVAFKYKGYQWVSSTGKVPYFDSVYDLSYKRKLTSKLSFDIGGRFGQSDYTGGLDPNFITTTRTHNPRSDTQTTFLTGVSYAFNANASVSLAYALDLGRNLEDGITPDTRNFNRNVISLGAVFKF